MKLRSALAGVLVGTLIAIPVVVAASSHAGHIQPGASSSNAPVPHRTVRILMRPDHITRRHWTAIDEPKPVRPQSGLTIPGTGPFTLTLSGDLSGAGIRLRVLEDGIVIRPGVASFVPSPGSHSFSLTFAQPFRTFGCGRVRLQWKSVTGRPVQLRQAIVRARYPLYRVPHPVCT
jgi:hypothetical protein